MRTGLLAAALLLLVPSAAQSAEPPLPPIVFQTQPIGRIFDDLRAAADIVGGEKGVKALNEGLKKLLGEKGLEGLDISRPLVGYVVLAPKPQDITAVLAFPVTGEKEFLACQPRQQDKLKVDEKDKSLYHMPPLEPQYKALMRFKDRYAYIAYGADPRRRSNQPPSSQWRSSTTLASAASSRPASTWSACRCRSSWRPNRGSTR